MGTDEHVCPECGQPVATMVHRYKTLGAWVPRWGPGPCRNPKCAAYADRPGRGQGQGQERGRGPGHGQGHGDGEGQDLPEEPAAEKS
ncbi:hypothetical protein ACFYW8_14090 [Streptomyces sp. NPDC002742]|uniref:hypothetical protein n=1 Tax=Streptomyces sp. NPDC002742 TaxID=3364663 RepID=UPI0036C45C87